MARKIRKKQRTRTRGRPVKYNLTQERRTKALLAARAVTSYKDVAEFVGVSPTVLLRWLETHEDFRVEFNKNRAQVNVQIQKKAMEYIGLIPDDEGKTKEPSIPLLIFLLKSRCGLREVGGAGAQEVDPFSSPEKPNDDINVNIKILKKAEECLPSTSKSLTSTPASGKSLLARLKDE